MSGEAPLVLGGHTFIEDLGNDPAISAETQVAIVEMCFEHGVSWFDTTYEPERVALGEALAALDRTDDATVFAWNFFGGERVPPSPYESEHAEVMLDQLGTDSIDYLVVHPVDDAAAQERQVELAIGWRDEGLVEKVGTFNLRTADAKQLDPKAPYEFVVEPFNVSRRETAAVFEAASDLGWETFAASPFVRGWELDALLEAALDQGTDDVETIRRRLADHMLRYSLHEASVDRVIVSMRRVEWIKQNIESARRGALSDDQREWLEAVAAAADTGS